MDSAPATASPQLRRFFTGVFLLIAGFAALAALGEKDTQARLVNLAVAAVFGGAAWLLRKHDKLVIGAITFALGAGGAAMALSSATASEYALSAAGMLLWGLLVFVDRRFKLTAPPWLVPILVGVATVAVGLVFVRHVGLALAAALIAIYGAELLYEYALQVKRRVLGLPEPEPAPQVASSRDECGPAGACEPPRGRLRRSGE